MKRPPFPFRMMLTRAEEIRDERQVAYLRRRELWREQQRATRRQKIALNDLFAQLGGQRSIGLSGAMEHNYRLYLGREEDRLSALRTQESKQAREAEAARQEMLRASLQLRVWESLRDRFWNEWDLQQRRRQEAELEDWTRSRLKRTRSRAVV